MIEDPVDSVDGSSASPNAGATTWVAVDQLKSVLERSSKSDTRHWLAPSELERLARISRRVRQEQFLAGRWLLREMLASIYPATHAPDWSLGAIAGGVPSILMRPSAASLSALLNLSVSHSGERVAAAVSRSPVGVDLECIRPGRNLEELAELACDRLEQHELRGLDADARAVRFHLIWTVKEAWLKCWGDGLDPARLQQLHTRAGDKPASWSARACHSSGWVLAIAGASANTVRWVGECFVPPDSLWETFCVLDDHRV